MSDKLLTTKEAAVYLDVNYRSLLDSRLRDSLSGRKPPEHVKKGRFVFYKLKELDDWLKNKKPTERKLW